MPKFCLYLQRMLPLCIVILCSTGCVQSIADRMVTGPNARYTPDQVRSLQLSPEAPGTIVDQGIRVPVDARGKDASAEIAIWVVEPSDEQVELTNGGAALRATQPATDQAVQAKGTVVLLHGLWHHKGRRIYTLWARLFAANGYRCVLVDLRSHGQSTGTLVSYGVHEAQDTRQVLDELERRGLIDGPLTLMGGSMGAATAIQLAAQDQRVDSVVALAPFSSLDEAVESVAEAVFLLAFLMPDAFWDDYAEAVCERNAMTTDQTDNVAAASRAKSPMLIIAAGDDNLIPPSHARAIYKQAPEGSRLHIAEGEDHRSIARAIEPGVMRLVLGWLDERLAARKEGHPPQAGQANAEKNAS